MPPPPQPNQAGNQPGKPQAHAAASAPSPLPPLDWDTTISLVEQSLPSQYFAFELIRELGRALTPPAA